MCKTDWLRVGKDIKNPFQHTVPPLPKFWTFRRPCHRMYVMQPICYDLNSIGILTQINGHDLQSIEMISFDFWCMTIWWIKVHIFWEGHKILQNLHRRFVLCSSSQIYSGDFLKLLAFWEYMNFRIQFLMAHEIRFWILKHSYFVTLGSQLFNDWNSVLIIFLLFLQVRIFSNDYWLKIISRKGAKQSMHTVCLRIIDGKKSSHFWFTVPGIWRIHRNLK